LQDLETTNNLADRGAFDMLQKKCAEYWSVDQETCAVGREGFLAVPTMIPVA